MNKPLAASTSIVWIQSPYPISNSVLIVPVFDSFLALLTYHDPVTVDFLSSR